MRKVLKWGGITVASLLALVVVSVSGFYTTGRVRMGGTWDPPATGSLPVSSVAVARGEHILATHGCVDCHGENLEGKPMMDMPLANVIAPNLTRGKGGVGGDYKSADDWGRAVRQGVRPDGTLILPFMPYTLFHGLADDDMAALAAYLSQVAPADHEQAPSKMRFLGYMIFGMPGASPKKLIAKAGVPPKTAPTEAADAQYGAYLASHMCVECHGPTLNGGKSPDPSAPPVPTLRPAATWSAEDFASLLRTGIGPLGKKVSEAMPYSTFKNMTDLEVQAVHAHLKALAAEPQPAEK